MPKKLSTQAIYGIAAAVIIGVLALVLGLYFGLRKSQTKNVTPNVSTLATTATPALPYTVSTYDTMGQQVTGVAQWKIPTNARPALVFATGRHTLKGANCYVMFPDDTSPTHFSAPVYLTNVKGNFSNVEIQDSLALFSGDANYDSLPYSVMPSQVFQMPMTFDATSWKLLWSQPAANVNVTTTNPRNACFGKNKDVIVGMTDGTLQIYSGPSWSTYNVISLQSIPGCHTTYVGLSYNPNSGVVAAGGRFPWSGATGCNPNDPPLSFIIEDGGFGAKKPVDPGRTPPENYPANIVATYAGSIITPNDALFVGSSDNQGEQGGEFLNYPFILKNCEHKQRVVLTQVPIQGRSTAVYDITGNGLPDIFIVCEMQPHLLLLQTSPGTFFHQFIPQVGDGQFRGITIGRIFGSPNTVEVVLTSVTGASNVIYSFKQKK